MKEGGKKGGWMLLEIVKRVCGWQEGEGRADGAKGKHGKRAEGYSASPGGNCMLSAD